MSKLGISSLFKTILLTAALAVSFTASAFTEGTDYMVLEKPIPNADKTLIKVFSYACRSVTSTTKRLPVRYRKK